MFCAKLQGVNGCIFTWMVFRMQRQEPGNVRAFVTVALLENEYEITNMFLAPWLLGQINK